MEAVRLVKFLECRFFFSFVVGLMTLQRNKQVFVLKRQTLERGHSSQLSCGRLAGTTGRGMVCHKSGIGSAVCVSLFCLGEVVRPLVCVLFRLVVTLLLIARSQKQGYCSLLNSFLFLPARKFCF